MDFRSFAPQKLFVDDAFAFCLLLLLIEEFDSQSWKLAQNAFKCDEAAKLLFLFPPSPPRPRFPATFWWTSNELNNSKGVASFGFKFQVLLSLCFYLCLCLAMEFVRVSSTDFAPWAVLPYSPTSLRCALSRIDFDSRGPWCSLISGVDKVAGSKVARITLSWFIYYIPHSKVATIIITVYDRLFTYSITCSCCSPSARSVVVVVVVVAVACVVIFRPPWHWMIV